MKPTRCSLVCLILLAAYPFGPADTTLQAENFEVMVAPLVPHKRYGAPALVELKDGRILLAYDEWTILGETNDFSDTLVKARYSEDGGRTWGRPFVLQENFSRMGRIGNPNLFRLQSGGIGFVYSELNSHTDKVYFFKTSTDEAETWSSPVQVTGEPAYYVMNNHRVIQHSSGRLLAPFCFVPDISKRQDYSFIGFCYYSDDDGATWHRGKKVELPRYPVGIQEPGLVELKDGSVLMIIRNAHERVYRSVSRDRGVSWSDPEPMEQLVAPVAPATIMRVPRTGDLAIVWNYSPKVRTPLAIAVSKDEGGTWENIKYLESGYFSYAYCAFLFPADSGRLLLCYWVRNLHVPGTIGLKVRGIDVEWLYEE